MTIIKREVTFFEEAGPSNTSSVVNSVKERLLLKDVDTVIVPVTTGGTSRLFSKELKGLAEVIKVSEDEALSACRIITEQDEGFLASLVKRRIHHEMSKRNKREAFDITFLPFCGERWDAVKNILYVFSQGMKVAIEIAVIAVELGKVEPYQRIISVGGSEGGVDTAIVLRTSTQKEAFGSNKEKRLTVLEIINMPMEK